MYFTHEELENAFDGTTRDGNRNLHINGFSQLHRIGRVWINLTPVYQLAFTPVCVEAVITILSVNPICYRLNNIT